MAVTLAARGGGGGGGFSSGSLGDGTSGNGSKNKFHHDAEVGKWGSGNATGGGFGGNGGTLGGVSDIYINGNPSLDVTGYTFNGTTYSDLKDFAKAIFEIGTTEDVFYVNFNVNGESAPRTARIRANGAANPGDDLTIDYQYKATYTIQTATATSATPQEAFYYKRDDLALDLPALSDSDYVNEGGIDYHENKWKVGNNVCPPGRTNVYISGDASLGNITPTPDTSYGFRSSDNALVVNQTSGTVSVNTAGGKTVSKIELPASDANGSITLNLSSIAGLNNIQTTGSTPAVTNGEKLRAVTFPNTSFTLGRNSFRNCTNITSVDLSNCTSVGNGALTGCSNLISVGDMSRCMSVEPYAFEKCYELVAIDLSNCTSIGNFTCNYCYKLSSVGDLSNCTSIGRYAFCRCSSLTSVNLSSCTTIGVAAFRSSGLNGTINLPNCISLDTHSFVDCIGITSANLPNCTTIGDFAFNGCTNLTSVTFGSNITTIGQGAFDDSDATFYFFSSPHNVTYDNPNVFKQGATAIWDDGMQQYIYKWNRSANSGNGGWDPF